jgi:type I restriction enzyme, S subunit
MTGNKQQKPWPIVPLGEVLTPVSRPEKLDLTTEYRLLGVRLDGAGPFLRETKLGSQIAATTLSRVEAGDFIYSRLFAWRGAFGIISEDLDGCHVSGEFPTFTANPGKLDPKFLRYWFRLPTTLETVEADCTGSTPLTRNRFKEEFFLALEIPLPQVAEQRRIVARIEQLAAQIEEARRLKEEITKDEQRVLRAAFAGFVKGGQYKPMREVAPLVRRPVEVDPEAEYPELGIRSFGKGTFHKPAVSGFELGTKRLYRIEPGDLVFMNVFAWEGAVAVAKPENAGRFGSHRFITCAAKPDMVTAGFLCFYFLTEEGLEKLRDASPGGAGRNRTLGLTALGNIDVPVPPMEKQLWFDGLAGQVAALARLQSQTASALDALLPSILDKAFKGEL